LNISQIEEIVKKLATDIIASEVNKDEFIYQLMAAYGHRKTTIGRIKSGERNLANVEGEVRTKRHIYFKQSQSNCVLSDIDSMKKEPSVFRDKIRFVIATDFKQFVAIDTRTHDTLDIEFNELGKHFDFFLPWAGMEKAVYQGENPADVKAAEKMAKLFDLIKADNFNEETKNDTAALHNLNVFLTRLLFCFFAEDTGIFKQNQFSSDLESHTKIDGSDVDNYLNRLFAVLNTSKETRGDLPDYLTNFEYVNGGLFANTITSPMFSTKSRKMLIECGSELDWSDINPDIFGSMIQAVVHPDQRGGMGMHYTSVTNIMKVIEPLFLDELYAEFENIEDNIDAKLKPSRLRKLHDRIAEIKLFDPACGSGNFLIIAFKELRKLEMEIIKRLQELDKNENQDDLFGDVGLDSSFSRVKLSQFYGIELDDFAHEVAILSLWLAEHQMNVEFKAEFGECEPTLPLQSGGHIVAGNATSIDWNIVCNANSEVKILGNPPYLGNRYQQASQKVEIRQTCNGISNSGNLDYIACWFVKAAKYINSSSNTKAAFVSTNSICQGSQVELLWPYIFSLGVEINFAYQTFRWTNNARNVAAVHCVIICLSKLTSKPKRLYSNELIQVVENINGYLANGRNVIVKKINRPISPRPKMDSGSKATDGGHLILSGEEKDKLLSENPLANVFIKKIYGAQEFIKGTERWCLWIKNADLQLALSIPEISERVTKCKIFRLESSKLATQRKAEVSHQFDEVKHLDKPSIIVPTVTSERRDYLPIGYLNENQIVIAPNNAIYNSELYIFGIISSKMHMVWIRAVAGRLKSDYRYSSALCYNSFPIPKLNEDQVSELEEKSLRVLGAREVCSDKTIAQLYDPEIMPDELKNAHSEVDKSVDRIYSNKSDLNDDTRLLILFDLYEKMTGGQNA
jgi:hypothetical protein